MKKLGLIYRSIIDKGLLVPLLFALLLPPVCGIILGYEFSGHLIHHVPTAIVDHDNSTLSRSLVDKIRTNDVFDVRCFGQDDDDIKKWIESGEALAGVIIPENFAADMLEGQAPKILVLYDGSQMGAAGAVKSRISEIMGTIKSGYLLQVMEGKLNLTPAEAQNYIQPIAYTTRFLGNPVKSSSAFFLQGILVNIVQVSIFILGIETVNKKQKNFWPYLKSSVFCGLIGTVSAAVTLWIYIGWFSSPFNGSMITALALTALNMIGLANIGIILSLLAKKKLIAVECATLILATMLLSGYTFPAIALPDIFQTIAKFMPFTYYGIPLRDVTLLGSTFRQVLPAMYWLVKFILLSWLVIMVVCKTGGFHGRISGFIKISGAKEAKEA